MSTESPIPQPRNTEATQKRIDVLKAKERPYSDETRISTDSEYAVINNEVGFGIRSRKGQRRYLVVVWTRQPEVVAAGGEKTDHFIAKSHRPYQYWHRSYPIAQAEHIFIGEDYYVNCQKDPTASPSELDLKIYSTKDLSLTPLPGNLTIADVGRIITGVAGPEDYPAEGTQ